MSKSLLREIVLYNNTRAGKVFDLVIQALILLSIISFSLETLKEFASRHKDLLRNIEIITVTIFTLEYVLRVYLSERKLKFIFSFFGIIDLLAILPFYISTGIDLRSFRALRFLRLFKFFRYGKSLHRVGVVLKMAKDELVMFFSLTCILIYLSGVGIYYFENAVQPAIFSSIFESLWWAVATLTTVGYGDIYPITTGGKVFTFVILMIGLGIVSIPAGIIASAFTKARDLEEKT